VRVADDGNGFDPEAVLEGMGLNSMRERIRALGGELSLRSAPEKGTEVIAHIPIGGDDGTYPNHLSGG